MFTDKTNKIIAFVCFLVIIAFSFLLAGNLIHIHVTNTNGNEFVLSYIYLFLILISAVIFYALFFNIQKKAINNNNKLESIIDSKNKEIDNYLKKNKKKVEDNKAKEEIFETEGHLKKIIPNIKLEGTNTKTYTESLLLNISKEIEIVVGLFYILDPSEKIYKIEGQYAFSPESSPVNAQPGEGLTGQVAINKELLYISDVPEDYIEVYSGLGKSIPKHILISPIIYKNKTIGILELGTFKPFTDNYIQLIKQLTEQIAENINQLIKSDASTS